MLNNKWGKNALLPAFPKVKLIINVEKSLERL